MSWLVCKKPSDFLNQTYKRIVYRRHRKRKKIPYCFWTIDSWRQQRHNRNRVYCCKRMQHRSGKKLVSKHCSKRSHSRYGRSKLRNITKMYCTWCRPMLYSSFWSKMANQKTWIHRNNVRTTARSVQLPWSKHRFRDTIQAENDFKNDEIHLPAFITSSKLRNSKLKDA
jgi:hypothetical protein